MSSDPGSSVNGTTNFIEDWGPDPWGIGPYAVDPGSADPGSADPASADPASADPGSIDPASAEPQGEGTPPTFAEHLIALGENGVLPLPFMGRR